MQYEYRRITIQEYQDKVKHLNYTILISKSRYWTFLGVVEPLTGASFAFFSAGERLPILAYLGGGIVLVGIVLQVMAGTGKKESVPTLG